MLTDAHFHADDLYSIDPGFSEAYRSLGTFALASVHDGAGLESTRSIMEGQRYLVSFGIHPQLPIMDEADELERLTSIGAIAAIGECGFDFYGDAPRSVRSPESEREQTTAFEFQLELAFRYGLPMVLHMRRANDMLWKYAKRLSALRAVVLHAWGGPANEAMDFLARCPRSLFSFGTGLVNGNKKAGASAAALPARSVLTETDAPYQPPRSSPSGGTAGNTGGRWPLIRAYSTATDIELVVAALAAARGASIQSLEISVENNFKEAFCHGV